MAGTRSRIAHPVSSARHERRLSSNRRSQGRPSGRHHHAADADDEDDEPTTPKQRIRAHSELHHSATPKSHRRTRSNTFKARPDRDSILATPAPKRLRVRPSLAGPFLQETTVAERARITSSLAKGCIINFLRAGLTGDVAKHGVSQHCRTAWDSLQAQRRNHLFVDNHMPFSYDADVLQSLHKDVRGRIDTVPLERANHLCNLAAYIRIIVDPDHATDIIDPKSPVAALAAQSRLSPSRKGKQKAISAEALQTHVKNRNRLLMMAWKHFWTVATPADMRSNERAINVWLEFSTQILLSFCTTSIDDWLEAKEAEFPPPDDELVDTVFAPSAIARRGQWAAAENGGTPGPGGANWELGLALSHWTNVAGRRRKKLVETREEILARKYRYHSFRESILQFIDDQVLPALFGQGISPQKPVLPELAEDDGTDTASQATRDTSTDADIVNAPAQLGDVDEPLQQDAMDAVRDGEGLAMSGRPDSDTEMLEPEDEEGDNDRLRDDGDLTAAVYDVGPRSRDLDVEVTVGEYDNEVIDYDQLDFVLTGMSANATTVVAGHASPDKRRVPLVREPATPKSTKFSFVTRQKGASQMSWDSPGGGTPSPRKRGEPLFLPFQGSDSHAEVFPEEDLMPDSSQLGTPGPKRARRTSVRSAQSVTPRAARPSGSKRPEPLFEEEDLMPDSSQLGSPVPDHSRHSAAQASTSAAPHSPRAKVPAPETILEEEDLIPESVIGASVPPEHNPVSPSRVQPEPGEVSRTPRPGASAQHDQQLDEVDLLPGSPIFGSSATGTSAIAALPDQDRDQASEAVNDRQPDDGIVPGVEERTDTTNLIPDNSVFGSPARPGNTVTVRKEPALPEPRSRPSSVRPPPFSGARAPAMPNPQRNLANHHKHRREAYEFAGPDSEESESVEETPHPPVRVPRPSQSVARDPLREIARNSLGLTTPIPRSSAGPSTQRAPVHILRRSPIVIDDIPDSNDIMVPNSTFADVEPVEAPAEPLKPDDPYLVDDDGDDLEPRATYTIPANYKAPPSVLHGKAAGQVSTYSRKAGMRKWSKPEELLLYRTVQKVPLDQTYPLRVVWYLHGEHGILSHDLEDFNPQHMKDKMKTVVETRLRNHRPIEGRARFWLPRLRSGAEHPDKVALKKEMAEATEVAMQESKAEIEAEHAAAAAAAAEQAARRAKAAKRKRAGRTNRDATESDELESIASSAESHQAEDEVDQDQDSTGNNEPDVRENDEEGEDELSDEPRRPRTRRRGPVRKKQALPVPETPPTGRRGRSAQTANGTAAANSSTSPAQTTRASTSNQRRSNQPRRPAQRLKLIPVVELPTPRRKDRTVASRPSEPARSHSPDRSYMEFNDGETPNDEPIDFPDLESLLLPVPPSTRRSFGRSARRSLRSHRPPTPPSISGMSSEEDDDATVGEVEIKAEAEDEGDSTERVYEDLKEDDDMDDADQPDHVHNEDEHDTNDDAQSYDPNEDIVRREQLKRRIYAGEDDETPRR